MERRESTPPFDPTKKLRINEKNIKNHTQLFGTRNDDEMDASLIEEFHSKLDDELDGWTHFYIFKFNL